jgi:hypothetical protein
MKTIVRLLALAVTLPVTIIALVGQRAATPRSLRRPLSRDVRTARRRYPPRTDFIEDARLRRAMDRGL